MVKTTLYAVVIMLFQYCNVYSQHAKKIPSEKPRLIVGIIVSQMRYDYVFRFWDKLSDNGIKLLIDRGTFCKNTSFNYLYSQDGVGHASIVTGTTPSNHGIIAQQWYLNLQDKMEQYTEDPSHKAVGGDYDNGHHSPRNLMCTTFPDELRLSNDFRSKVFSVALEPGPAIFSAGHTGNCSYWFDPRTGSWITSTYYTDSLAAWAKEFNDKKLPDIYLSQEWNTLFPIGQYTESLPDNNKYETGYDGRITFPYPLTEISGSRKNQKNYTILMKTPYGNLLTKDFVSSLVIGEELGKDDYTDVLMVSFTANESIGILFGPNSIEVEDALIRLDLELAHFFQFLDSHVGKENMLIFLTSGSGVAQVPSYLVDSKIPAGYFNHLGAIALLKSALNNTYGRGNWVKAYQSQQIFLNHTLIEDSKLSLRDVQDYTAQFMLQFAGVANTVTSYTLQSTNFTSGIFQKIQNSYNQKRSGDVMINLKANWVEKGSGSTDHNSSYAYDSKIPLIWYGWKIGRGTITRPVDITDIAPTISTFLDISYPNACTGSPIPELVQ
ncbi:MAG: alkaline phosphatase family protein [Bacteroidales bacterium]|nr:alkaline phosphatase family protein [Bacteroidales bacterium]